MSDRNYSITECVETLTNLTEQNLQILESINQCFYTKSSTITTVVDDNTYTIPSFLYLESKINELSQNFENLVNAPTTGQASFSFDGNTQSIMMQGFENAPNYLDLSTSTNISNLKVFDTENRDVLKDFTTPYIYTKLQLSDIPTHINEVYVKKIVINNSDLKSLIDFDNAPGGIEYSTMYSYLFNYTEDLDYVEYDTRYVLPIKNPDASGLWGISSIDSSGLDSGNFSEYIEITTNEDLTYTTDNETITSYLEAGDILISYDDKCKFEVLNVDISNRSLKLQVIQGYANLMSTSTTSSYDHAYLKYFDNQLHDDDSRTLKIPLEEDQYVVLFVSPINSQLNVRSDWGTGVYFDVHNMRYQENSSNATLFDSYYNENINNIGDVIYDLVKFTSASLSNLQQETFQYLTTYKPTISTSNFTVSQTNKHIFDNVNLDTIRTLNKQKAEDNNRLLVIQNELEEIDSILSTTDFSSLSTSTRSAYETRQSELNTEKNSLTNDLISLSNQITYASNDTAIPTADAEYGVIGYIDIDTLETLLESNIDDAAAQVEILKINVIYRYKGTSNTTTDTVVIDDVFTYSTWKEMESLTRQKEAYYDDSTQTIKYKLQDTLTSGSQQFNSINIPIKYGEIVSFKVQLQYSLGYPYVTVTSDWSDMIDIEFPDSLITDTDISDILTQNEKDVNILEFKDVLLDDGVTEHVQDYTVDQDKTYFHKPDSISSGFYTDDSLRVISLKDKLYDMNSNINTILSYIDNSMSQQLTVTLDDAISNLTIRPNEINQVFTTPNIISLIDDSTSGNLNYTVNLILSNTGSVPITLYSMYYGDKDVEVVNANSQWNSVLDNYWIGDGDEVIGISTESDTFESQTCNQYIYFRRKLPFMNTDIMYGIEEFNERIEVDSSVLVGPDDDVDLSVGDSEGNVEGGSTDDGVNTNPDYVDGLFDDTDELNPEEGDVTIGGEEGDGETEEGDGGIGGDIVDGGESSEDGEVTPDGGETGGDIVDGGESSEDGEVTPEDGDVSGDLGDTETSPDLVPEEGGGEVTPEEDEEGVVPDTTEVNITAYPYISAHSLIHIDSSAVGSTKTIDAGDGLVIPININITYNSSEDLWSDVEYPYISFSIWTSQFSEPTNYTFKLKVPYNESISPIISNTQIYTAVVSS